MTAAADTRGPSEREPLRVSSERQKFLQHNITRKHHHHHQNIGLVKQ